MNGLNAATAEHSTSEFVPNNRSRIYALLMSTVAIAAVWFIVLPWYATQPTMKRHLEFLEDRGIDPSAMFYTELDAMDPILDKIESRR